MSATLPANLFDDAEKAATANLKELGYNVRCITITQVDLDGEPGEDMTAMYVFGKEPTEGTAIDLAPFYIANLVKIPFLHDPLAFGAYIAGMYVVWKQYQAEHEKEAAAT